MTVEFCVWLCVRETWSQQWMFMILLFNIYYVGAFDRVTAAQCRGLSCEIEAKCASHNKMAPKPWNRMASRSIPAGLIWNDSNSMRSPDCRTQLYFCIFPPFNSPSLFSSKYSDMFNVFAVQLTSYLPHIWRVHVISDVSGHDNCSLIRTHPSSFRNNLFCAYAAFEAGGKWRTKLELIWARFHGVAELSVTILVSSFWRREQWT